MAIAMLQQRVVVHIGGSDCWDMVGVWGRWTILLTSHWVEAIVLGPVRQGQTQYVGACVFYMSDSAVKRCAFSGGVH